jgi:hypothetical protein
VNRINKFTLLLTSVCLAAGISGCAGVQTSSHSYNDSYKPNQPVKGDGCYDASVVLAKNLSDSKAIAKKVLAALDSTIGEETESQIKAQRNRHIGVFAGSGGEELAITLNEVSNGRTFVTATTKTGFVGGAGQKAWSCQIVDEMVKMAST